jgi:hypothetical protein
VNSLFTQNVIAIIWDFDKTLIPGYMQEPIFKEFHIDEKKFWKETNGLPKYYKERNLEVAPDSAYLNHFLTYARAGKFDGKLNNDRLKQMGGLLKFYPGIPQFLAQIKEVVNLRTDSKLHGITLEQYIVSTGLRQIILGSEIAAYVDGVWGCEFIEEPAAVGYLDGSNGSDDKAAEISQIGYVIDNTTKTRAIFEINKGSNKLPINVNDTIAREDRRVPFQNMIYIADGPSDVPVFSVLNQYGGRTFAVYDPDREDQFVQVKELQRQGRIQGYGPANYNKGTQAYLWLMCSVREIANEIVRNRTMLLEQKVGKSPVHLVEEMKGESGQGEEPSSLTRYETSNSSSASPSKTESAHDDFSLSEFIAILRSATVALTEEETDSSYRALLKYGAESASSTEQIRERAKRFANQLSDEPRTEDLFLGGVEGPPKHRLPLNSRDWEKI